MTDDFDFELQPSLSKMQAISLGQQILNSMSKKEVCSTGAQLVGDAYLYLETIVLFLRSSDVVSAEKSLDLTVSTEEIQKKLLDVLKDLSAEFFS